MGIKLNNLKGVQQYVKQFEINERKKIVHRLQFCANKFVVYARNKSRQEGQYVNMNVKAKNKAFIFSPTKMHGPGGGTNMSSPGFFDWTSNLRSSIGYIIVYNGKAINENFESSGGDEGVQDAKDFASSLISQVPPDTYAVICVAGMDYAAYVEAKGYDVITGGSILLSNELKKFF